MKKGSIGIWILWIVLTLLIAGGEFYYFQFTKIPDLNNKVNDLQSQINQLNASQKEQATATDETADWLTKELGGITGPSIKYPPDWFYKKVTFETGVYEMFYNDQTIKDNEQKLSGDQARLSIEIGPNNTPTATIAKVISDQQTFLKGQHPTATFQTKTINNMQALVADYKTGSQNDRIYYFVKKDATAFLTASWIDAKYSDTFDSMAETFELGTVNS